MSMLASASESLKFYQWPEGTLLQNYNPVRNTNYDGYIQSISWSKDGTWMVLVPKSSPIEIISIKDNIKLLQTVQDVSYPRCAAFQNTTKKHIAIGTTTGQILVYDIKGRSVRTRFPRISSDVVFNLEYNANDTHLAVGCSNGEVLLFNNQYVKLSETYKIPKSNKITAINFHRTKRNLLAAASEEGFAAVWDINNSNGLQFNLLAHRAPVTDLKLSPIRSDLLVTSGLDRTFAFYDIASKKRLLEVTVNSSITSLDFSNCGYYLGLGSQNGNITIYDTRKMAKPISSFEGYPNRRVQHLRFQKSLPESKSNSIYNEMSMVELSISKSHQEPQEINSPSRFDWLIDVGNCNEPNPSAVDVKEPVKGHSHDASDSFLVAMGLNSNTQSEASLKSENNSEIETAEEMKKLTDVSKQTSLTQCSSQKSILTHTPGLPLKQMSSTPKYCVETPAINFISPIISSSQVGPSENQSTRGTIAMSQQIPLTKDELKGMIKETFQEEITQQLEEHKNEMKSVFSEAMYHIRSNYLGLHWMLVKEFMEIRTSLEKISNPTCKNCRCNKCILTRRESN